MTFLILSNIAYTKFSALPRKAKRKVQILFPNLLQNQREDVIHHILEHLQKDLCKSNELSQIDIRQIMKKLGEDSFVKEITPLGYLQYMRN